MVDSRMPMQRLDQYHAEVDRLVFQIVDKGDDGDYRMRVMRFLEDVMRRAMGSCRLALSGSFPLRVHLLDSDLDLVLLAPPPPSAHVLNAVDDDLAITLQVFQGICNEIAASDASTCSSTRRRRGSGSSGGDSSRERGDKDKERSSSGGSGSDILPAPTVAATLSGFGPPSSSGGGYQFPIRNVTFVNGRTKVVHMTVDSLPVDVTINQRGALATAVFMEEVDRLVGRHHLFKRSVLLVKAFLRYESQHYTASRQSVLDSKRGMLSTYALNVMLVYVFNQEHELAHPLDALRSFLFVFSSWDWNTLVLTIDGPAVITTSRAGLSFDVQRASIPPGFQNRFGGLVERVVAASPLMGDVDFPMRGCNILDPLDSCNNLGYSLSRGSLAILCDTLRKAHKRVEDILAGSVGPPQRHSTNTRVTLRTIFPELTCRFVDGVGPGAALGFERSTGAKPDRIAEGACDSWLEGDVESMWLALLSEAPTANPVPPKVMGQQSVFQPMNPSLSSTVGGNGEESLLHKDHSVDTDESHSSGRVTPDADTDCVSTSTGATGVSGNLDESSRASPPRAPAGVIGTHVPLPTVDFSPSDPMSVLQTPVSTASVSSAPSRNFSCLGLEGDAADGDDDRSDGGTGFSPSSDVTTTTENASTSGTGTLRDERDSISCVGGGSEMQRLFFTEKTPGTTPRAVSPMSSVGTPATGAATETEVISLEARADVHTLVPRKGVDMSPSSEGRRLTKAQKRKLKKALQMSANGLGGGSGGGGKEDDGNGSRDAQPLCAAASLKVSSKTSTTTASITGAERTAVLDNSSRWGSVAVAALLVAVACIFAPSMWGILPAYGGPRGDPVPPAELYVSLPGALTSWSEIQLTAACTARLGVLVQDADGRVRVPSATLAPAPSSSLPSHPIHWMLSGAPTVVSPPLQAARPTAHDIAASACVFVDVPVDQNASDSPRGEGGKGEVTYRWVRDGILVHESTDGILVLENSVSAQDETSSSAGLYHCFAVYSDAVLMREALLFQTQLVLAVAPSSTTRSKYLPVKMGKELRLTVEVRGMPQPSLQWFRNGFKLEGQTSATISKPKAGRDDIGAYTLVMQNLAGTYEWAEASVVVIA